MAAFSLFHRRAYRACLFFFFALSFLVVSPVFCALPPSTGFSLSALSTPPTKGTLFLLYTLSQSPYAESCSPTVPPPLAHFCHLTHCIRLFFEADSMSNPRFGKVYVQPFPVLLYRVHLVDPPEGSSLTVTRKLSLPPPQRRCAPPQLRSGRTMFFGRPPL